MPALWDAASGTGPPVRSSRSRTVTWEKKRGEDPGRQQPSYARPYHDHTDVRGRHPRPLPGCSSVRMHAAGAHRQERKNARPSMEAVTTMPPEAAREELAGPRTPREGRAEAHHVMVAV